MKTVAFLGDTHLGRRFRTGVPLQRLGEREDLIREDFYNSLTRQQPEIHIHLGDLFDKPVVSPDDVLFAAAVYTSAANTYQGTMFYILLGNHDASKNSELKTSFDLFEAIMAPFKNVVCVKEPMLVDGIGLCPYNVFGTAEDYLRRILAEGTPELVVGHWDIAFGDANLIPTHLMQEAGITKAVTGHDHLKRMERRHGVDITVFGSMQPYSHAEDATGEWYVTVELDEALKGDFTNKNLRVLLKEGEVLPVDIDCLSIIGKRVASDDKIEVDTTSFEQFDLRAALMDAIPERIRDRVMTVYNS